MQAAERGGLTTPIAQEVPAAMSRVPLWAKLALAYVAWKVLK